MLFFVDVHGNLHFTKTRAHPHSAIFQYYHMVHYLLDYVLQPT